MVSAPIPAPRGSVRRGSSANPKSYGGRAAAVGGSSGGGGVASLNTREVGQFLLGKTMGEGTFGEVKLAVHKPTSERVAAKVRGRDKWCVITPCLWRTRG